MAVRNVSEEGMHLFLEKDLNQRSAAVLSEPVSSALSNVILVTWVCLATCISFDSSKRQKKTLSTVGGGGLILLFFSSAGEHSGTTRDILPLGLGSHGGGGQPSLFYLRHAMASKVSSRESAVKTCQALNCFSLEVCCVTFSSISWVRASDKIPL